MNIFNTTVTIQGMVDYINQLLPIDKQRAISQDHTLNHILQIPVDVDSQGNRKLLGYMLGHDSSTSRHNLAKPLLDNLIPFVAREVSNDLTVTERNNYRLRKLKNIDGVLYALYYMKIWYDVGDVDINVYEYDSEVLTLSEEVIPPADTDWSMYTSSPGQIVTVGAPAYVNLSNLDMANIYSAALLLGIDLVNLDSIGVVIGEDVEISAGVREVKDAIMHSHVAVDSELFDSEGTVFTIQLASIIAGDL